MNDTTTTQYRVISIMTNDFGSFNHGHPSQVNETVMWSGTDIDALSRQYPPSKVFGADPLGHSEIEDGLIRYDYRFERQSADGSWEKINDPRVRLTPPTWLEAAIDEENRRLYPGDYLDDDPADYGPTYGCCDGRGCDVCDPSQMGPDCTNCDDYGCASCNPNASCKLCYDAGCDVCDPVLEKCIWCPNLFPEESLDNGLCPDCLTEVDRLNADADELICISCKVKLSSNETTTCTDCDDYYNPSFGSRLWQWLRSFFGFGGGK